MALGKWQVEVVGVIQTHALDPDQKDDGLRNAGTLVRYRQVKASTSTPKMHQVLIREPAMDDPVRNPYISPSNVGNADATGVNTSLLQHVRTGQLLTFSMIVGVIVMVGILTMVVRNPDNAKPDNAKKFFLEIGLGAGCVACIASYAVSTFQHRRALASFREQCGSEDAVVSDDELLAPAVTQFLANIFAATLAGQAVLEGAAVINVVLMVIDGNLLHLAVVAVMIVGMAMYTPTVARRRALIEQGLS